MIYLLSHFEKKHLEKFLESFLNGQKFSMKCIPHIAHFIHDCNLKVQEMSALSGKI